jgi:membrane protease YdiL (CAAX protease family)
MISNPKKSSLRALLAVGISMLCIYLLILRQRILHGPTPNAEPKLDSIRAAIPQLVLNLIYVLPAGFFMFKSKEGFRTVGVTRNNLWQSLLIGAGLALLTFYFQAGGLLAKLGHVGTRQAIALVFYGLVGFGEEFLFRGYLQTRLIAWLGKWLGWGAASVVMALVHFPHRWLIEGLGIGSALAESLGLVAPSLLMGFVMLRTQNIIAPGLFHMFADWVNTLR